MNLSVIPIVETDERRQRMIKRGRWLQYGTIGWNSLEFVIAVVAGLLAGSIALVGFGVDSAIEVTSGLAALWRLRSDGNETCNSTVDRRALRIIGVSFLLLALYVAYESAMTLVEQKLPHESIPGIILAALSLIVMPLLARFKRQVAIALGSGALEADTRQSEICAWLSAILLIGLGLNISLGWWWADPVAGLAMAPLIGWEGLEAVRGRTCCPD